MVGSRWRWQVRVTHSRIREAGQAGLWLAQDALNQLATTQDLMIEHDMLEEVNIVRGTGRLIGPGADALLQLAGRHGGP